MKRILVINPGSTSTKIALYEDMNEVFRESISHPADELDRFREIPDQLPYRSELIAQCLSRHQIPLETIDAYSAICTGLLPMQGGIYEINSIMCEHGRLGIGSKHPGNLGPLLARALADANGGRAFTVDPSSTDEFCLQARMTGLHDVFRTSRGHPLNQRAAARQYAKDCGVPYEEMNLVVAHMGGGISVSAHSHGRMVDTVDSTRGEGRMAPTRSGALPVMEVVELCFSGRYDKAALAARIMKKGGWTDHLGTTDAIGIEQRISDGDAYAALVYDTTAYQLAKDIAAMASVMNGQVNAVLLTGGLAYSEKFVSLLQPRIRFIAPVVIYPGEYEMKALAEGALDVLEGKAIPQQYTGAPTFSGFR